MTGSSFTDFRDLFANPPQDVRPEVRWWLAEGLHTDETLRTAQLTATMELGSTAKLRTLATYLMAIDHLDDYFFTQGSSARKPITDMLSNWVAEYRF